MHSSAHLTLKQLLSSFFSIRGFRITQDSAADLQSIIFRLLLPAAVLYNFCLCLQLSLIGLQLPFMGFWKTNFLSAAAYAFGNGFLFLIVSAALAMLLFAILKPSYKHLSFKKLAGITFTSLSLYLTISCFQLIPYLGLLFPIIGLLCSAYLFFRSLESVFDIKLKSAALLFIGLVLTSNLVISILLEFKFPMYRP